MRCIACNKRLSEFESTRKAVNTGEYIDLCNECFSTIADEVAYVDGNGSHITDFDEDFENDQQTGTKDRWESDM